MLQSCVMRSTNQVNTIIMRAQMLNRIVSGCFDFGTFKSWYNGGSFDNPVRDKLYLEAASKHDYFEAAKEMILKRHDWGEDINNQIKEFSEVLTK